MAVNKVILIGNVGKDPEVRYPQQGMALATFTLATTERAYSTANGTQVPERTEWHNLVIWGKNAEIAERYVKKGMKLYVEGKLRTRVWEDRNNIKRYVTEIYVDYFEMLSARTDAPAQQHAPQPNALPDFLSD